MQRTLLTSALVLGMAPAAMAQTSGSATPAPSDWMPISELASQLEEDGNTLLSIDADDGVYEVEMMSGEEQRVEQYFDLTSGEPVDHPVDD